MAKSLAEMRLELYQKDFGVMSYEELASLVSDLDKFLTYTPVTDFAWPKLSSDRRNFIRYMDLLDDAELLYRHSHRRAVKALIAIQEEVFERTFWISRSQLSEYEIHREIRDALKREDCLRDKRDIEVVILHDDLKDHQRS